MLIQVLNGVVYGALLYLLAVGLVLIFGLREVVNFAHGALFMVGAYLGFSVAAAGYWWGGLLVSVVAMGAIGGMLDAAVFRTLRKQDPMVTVLVTFGLLLILETVVTAIWGKAYLRYPMPAILSGTVTIAGSPMCKLFTILRTAISILCLRQQERWSKLCTMAAGIHRSSNHWEIPSWCKTSSRISSGTTSGPTSTSGAGTARCRRSS